MKKDSDELFQLVSSLTAGERRYCSLYLAKHNATGNNRYLKLFNLLQKESIYDGAAVKTKMGYKKKVNQFAVLKVQLYQQILDALNQFALFTDGEEQLFRNIYQCTLLYRRGLFTQSEKRVAVLEKTANAIHSDIAQLMIQNLKMSLIAAKKYTQISDTGLDKWYEQTQQIFDSAIGLRRSQYLKAKIYKIQNESGILSRDGAGKMKEIIDSMEADRKNSAQSLRASLNYYQAKGVYHHQGLEKEKHLENTAEELALLENNPELHLHTQIYRVALANYMQACLRNKKYDRFEKDLEKLKGLTNMPGFKRYEAPDFDPVLFNMTASLEIDYLINTGQFAAGYLKVNEIKSGMEQLGNKFPKYNRTVMLYSLAYICFALKKYDESLDILMPIIMEKEKGMVENLQLMARMLQLVCHFEKGDSLLAASLVKSLQRSFRGMDRSADILRATTSFINSCLHKVSLNHQDWTKFYDQVAGIVKNKTPEGFETVFQTGAWARGHRDGISFPEAWKLEMRD